jgi:pimeloyl-ACP methyl ester carboxylesterase
MDLFQICPSFLVEQNLTRLAQVHYPVFVANGTNDLLIPTENSFELSQILPNAHLHVYPNSGHGFLFQHAELFAMHIGLFLDSVDEDLEGGGTKMRANLA